jgi:hypothetical protein
MAQSARYSATTVGVKKAPRALRPASMSRSASWVIGQPTERRGAENNSCVVTAGKVVMPWATWRAGGGLGALLATVAAAVRDGASDDEAAVAEGHVRPPRPPRRRSSA